MEASVLGLIHFVHLHAVLRLSQWINAQIAALKREQGYHIVQPYHIGWCQSNVWYLNGSTRLVIFWTEPMVNSRITMINVSCSKDIPMINVSCRDKVIGALSHVSWLKPLCCSCVIRNKSCEGWGSFVKSHPWPGELCVFYVSYMVLIVVLISLFFYCYYVYICLSIIVITSKTWSWLFGVWFCDHGIIGRFHPAFGRHGAQPW